jgi:hypothetical protein
MAFLGEVKMSTDMIPVEKMNLPANIADFMAKMMEDATGGIQGGAAVNRISIKNGRFRLMVEGSEVGVRNDPTLDVVVVGVNPGVSKVYYKAAYDPKQEPSAPDCSSNNGVVPDGSSTNKQSVSCADCPQNVWGSKINQQSGAKVKACADYKRLAVVLDGELDGDMYQLQVPGGSLKSWKAWVEQVKVNRSNLLAVTTRVDATNQSLIFGKGRVLNPNEVKTCVHAAMSDGVNNLLNNNAATLDGASSEEKFTSAPVTSAAEIPSFTSPAKEEHKAEAKPRGRPAAPKEEPKVEVLPPEVQESDPVTAKLEAGFADFATATWDD